jgi:hypothetical protein
MSDTGEQGMTPRDPAESAGIGGGIIPDDQGEGYEQAAQVNRRSSDEKVGEPRGDHEADKADEPGESGR